MVAVAFVLFRLIADNESGKADARLAARPGGRRSTSTARTTPAPTRRRGGSRADVALAQALRANDRQALQARPARPARAGGRRADRRRATANRPHRRRRAARRRSSRRRATSWARASRVVRHAAGVRAGRPTSTRACSTASTGLECGRAAGRRPRARGHAARASTRGSIPRTTGELKVGDEALSTRRRSRRPASWARPIAVAVLAPETMESAAVRSGRLLARRRSWRLLHPRLHLRAAGLALAAAPDRRLPAGRAAPGLGRLHRRGPDRGPRRVRGAGRGVQQDVAPARGAPGGAQPGARAPAGRDAPHRRDVRREPRPRGRCWRSWSGPRSTASGPRPAAPRCGRTRARRSSRSRSPGRSTGSRRPCAPPRRRCSRPASRARRPSTASRAVAPDAPRRRRPRARLGRRLGGAPRHGRSAPPSASSSTTSPSRPRSRSRTSACTRRSSARR